MRRSLFLSGFMGSGKSTIGRLVAARVGAPFLDLDDVVARRADSSIQELFEALGEEGFRSLERAALLELLDGPPAVIALGGGALLDRRLRLAALARGVVVTLEAPLDVLLARTAAQGGRPLLAVKEPAAHAERLLDARASSYAEAHARVSAVGAPEEIAAAVEQIWRRESTAVAAGSSSYAVEIGRGNAVDLARRAAVGAPVTVLVTDEIVGPLHAAPIAEALRSSGTQLVEVVLPSGEVNKRPGALEQIWRGALAGGADRSALFVALGGGVVTDVTGFAAATYQRGVRWVALPTTLLAMVDASVGGKTAVDLDDAKNAVGAFWQPIGVSCDVDFLTTEGDRGFRAALAEVLKTALVGDAGLLALLEQHAGTPELRAPELVAELVRRSVAVKARIVSADEREQGLRAVLNLGHTVGHALESAAGFQGLLHGEAVALGLVAALRLGVGLRLTPPELPARVEPLLRRLELPSSLTVTLLQGAAPLLSHDKKRRGERLRFVLLRDVEAPEVHSLDLGELRERLPSLADAATLR